MIKWLFVAMTCAAVSASQMSQEQFYEWMQNRRSGLIEDPQNEACALPLIKSSTAVAVGDLIYNQGPTRLSVPVQIRQSPGEKIEVFSLSPGPPLKYNPLLLKDGPRVFFGAETLLDISDGNWMWPPELTRFHGGLIAYEFWTTYRPAVAKLLSAGTATLAEVLKSELHRFSWRARVAFLLRLPSRNPDEDDRFREMWLFTKELPQPIPIARAADSLRLNGEALAVDRHKVYRFEDAAGKTRYVFE